VRRWGLRALLALVVVTQVFTCQVALASPSIPASAVACQDDRGHDVVCETGLPAIEAPVVGRAGADDPARHDLGIIIALVLSAIVLAIGSSVAADPRAWATPRRLVRGRHRLLALGITRV
jgi:hypothetical protein